MIKLVDEMNLCGEKYEQVLCCIKLTVATGGEGLVKLGLLVRTKLFSTNENLLGRESRERGGGKGLVVDEEYGGSVGMGDHVCSRPC